LLRLRPAEQGPPGDVVTVTGKEKHEQNQGVQELLTGDCPILFHANSEDEDDHEYEGECESEAGEDAEQEQDADEEFDWRDDVAGRENEGLWERSGGHAFDHALSEAGEMCPREDASEAVAEEVHAGEEA
jgi:hypothetical protein